MAESLFPRLGFIGGGKMASALLNGLLGSNVTTKERLLVGEPLAEARAALARDTGATVLAGNERVVRDSDVLILAIKPQAMPSVLNEICPHVTDKHLIISIAAGVTLQQLGQGLGEQRRIIRVMPNTPCLVGAGASGYSLGKAATAEDGLLVERILKSVGKAFLLPENLLDAVTGLSGSGPAFAALVIEALSDGGVVMGLPRDTAQALAAQTVLGAARMILEAGLHPAALKDMVTSPGGTTAAGLHALERAGLRAALMDAVAAATRRAAELGKEQDNSKNLV